MFAKLCVVVLGLSVASLGGCSGGSSPGGVGGSGGTGGQLSTTTGAAPGVCVPGASVACACVTGQTGAQTCTSAGTFAACVCVAPAVDAGNLGETGGTTTADAPSGTGGAGGQVTMFPDAAIASTGGVDAVETGGQVVVMDSGMLADVGPVDAVYVPTGCGDGIVVPPEQCDDGNTIAGDGCSPTCKVEIGYKCSGSPSVCTPTVCGDGKTEGAERCDDGNTMPFDGCSEDCQIEPDCSGGSCTSKCGDGLVVPPEQCDDGNTNAGDGCSKDCKIEAGWTCTQPELGDKMMVPVIYRDFRYHNPVDFEPGVSGSYVPFPGMVNSTLDATTGKPVYSGIGGNAHVASADSFSQWYKDVSGVNHSTASKMTLWNNGQGAYVNRYGPNGERWNTTAIAYFCGYVGQETLDASGNPIPCTSASPDAGATDCTERLAAGETMLSCDKNNGYYSAAFIVSKVDGNPLFFPVDGDPFTPASELQPATIPPYYDASATWPSDLDANGNKRLHNFSFTSEIRYWFLYDKAKNYVLDFVGDDDVWVFINGKLAVDLGGIHTPVDGSIVIGANGNGTTTLTQTYPIPAPAPIQQSATLGLQDGQVYEIAVFQAERQSDASSFKLTLSGFNAAPSECTPCRGGITAGDGGCSNATGSPVDGAGPI